MAPTPTFTNNDSLKIGCIKWFNNKAGYGFITLAEEGESNDIFVHHSSIFVQKNQYKYLVQGEYVSFELEKVDGNEKYSHQAKSVRGVNCGPLMCETRNENSSNTDKQPRGRMVNKVDLGKQWMLVQKNGQARPNREGQKKSD
jgi:cold shock CspA family protein